MKIAVEDPQLPAEVESALNGFLGETSPEHLSMLQQAVVRSGLWDIGTDHFVILAVQLAENGQMALSEIAYALAQIPIARRKSLPPIMQHLLDVANAVVEDASDGVMEIQCDTLFRDAVQAVATSRQASQEQ